MRPLKLTMTAFGPYKDQEIIDFSELMGHRLFVVSGNTGAGKTSIFDAISFALYGDASGEDRNDSRMLRSHFADDNMYTSVDFIFELKGRKYRVFRQLAHVKEGNKGPTEDRYELYEVVHGGVLPLTDRLIVSQVDEKLREIIGLTKEQFSQIVMLPQGEFRKLLTSETENKEEILRRIFKTGLYKYVADQLNEKRKQMQQICTELANIKEYHIGNLKGSLAGREGSALYNVFQQQHYNTFQVLEALELETDYYAKQMDVRKQQLQAELTKQHEQTAVNHQAKNVKEQFILLDQKVTTKQQLLEQEQDILQKTARLERAREVVHLDVYEQLHGEMSVELIRKCKLLEDALIGREQAEATLQVAIVHYKQEEVNEELRKQTLLDLNRLQGYLPTVKEISQIEQFVLTLASESDVLSNQYKNIQDELEALQSDRFVTAAGVKELEAMAVLLPEKTEKLTLLQQQTTVILEYLNLVKKSLKEQEEEREYGEAFEQAERAYTEVENRWIVCAPVF
ncbi:AAA family ATPase [Paenibacillus harenae]|uniref:AAA family ATPase n=1 Tax=Paenibacillus harenae TaxID=306543 RepID=UPI00068572E7|nr:AAA family ATPase [Paenibacillus harenae]